MNDYNEKNVEVDEEISWDGEGLPPVGADVEFAYFCALDDEIIWKSAKVIGYDGYKAVVAIEDGNYAGSSYLSDFRRIDYTARQIKNAIFRESGIRARDGAREVVQNIYTAISEDRIPGIKLDVNHD